MIVTMSTFMIVGSIVLYVAHETGFAVLPAIAVTVLIHLILLPQTYQTHSLIADLDKARESLYVQSITDELTGAYNRRHFLDEVQQAIDQAGSPGNGLALIEFDLDDFKAINDTFGHHFGDEVLRHVGAICRAGARQQDVFARIGGEEFAFLLRHTTHLEALQFAERIRQAVNASGFTLDGHHTMLSVSVGVSIYQPQQNLEELLRSSDLAMYRAKSDGKNRVVPAACVRLTNEQSRATGPRCAR